MQAKTKMKWSTEFIENLFLPLLRPLLFSWDDFGTHAFLTESRSNTCSGCFLNDVLHWGQGISTRVLPSGNHSILSRRRVGFVKWDVRSGRRWDKQILRKKVVTSKFSYCQNLSVCVENLKSVAEGYICRQKQLAVTQKHLRCFSKGFCRK